MYASWIWKKAFLKGSATAPEVKRKKKEEEKEKSERGSLFLTFLS